MKMKTNILILVAGLTTIACTQQPVTNIQPRIEVPVIDDEIYQCEDFDWSPYNPNNLSDAQIAEVIVGLDLNLNECVETVDTIREILSTAEGYAG